MTKKILFLSLLVALFIPLFTLISCETPEQKVDDAFNKVREERMNPDSIVITKTKFVSKPLSPNEWPAFKIEMETKIAENESLLKELKSMPKSNDKTLATLERLEKENAGLKIKMTEYEEARQLQWENFKSKISQELEELSQATSELKIKVQK